MKPRSMQMSLLVLAASVTLTGCGDRGAGPTAADLARRQQLRESTAAAKPNSFEEKLRIARDHLTHDNLVGAQAELRQLLISDAGNPEVILLAAECEAEAGSKLVAAKMLDAIDDSNVDLRVAALFLAAQWEADEHEYDAAEAKLLEIIELRDNRLESADTVLAHRRLATLLNNQGLRLKAAKHLLFLALSGEIHEKELFAMNTYGNPFIDTSAPKPDFSKRLIPAALSQAKIYRHERDLPHAESMIEQLAAEFPDSTAISAFQGRVYSDLHDDAKLEQWLSHLPQGIESEPEYWYAVGIACQQKSQHREAVRAFAEAVTRDPTDRFSYLALSRSLTTLGEPELATQVTARFELLDEAARLAVKFGRQPGSSRELDRMAEILSELQRPAEAIAWRFVAIQRSGDPSAIADLVTRREHLRGSGLSEIGQLNPSEAFVTCGVKINDWPRPTMPEKVSTNSGEKIIGTSSNLNMRPTDVPLQLVDIASTVGLEFQYHNGDVGGDERVLLHQLTGGGIGVIDFDLDGWPDLYMTQGGGEAFDAEGSDPNLLFRNDGGQHFIDVTATANCGDRGYGQGVAVADINQDGLPDLMVANIGPNRVFVNQGDGTFSSGTYPAFEAEGRWTTSIACGDLSGDGLPEVVDVNYVDDLSALATPCTSSNTRCNPSSFQSAADVVWRLDATGQLTRFDDVWLGGSQPGYGFAAVIANFDGVAGNDLFIANDTIENFFWLSTSDDASSGYRLAESAHLYGCATGMLGQRQGCMGIACGDFDRNGRLDLHVTNFWNQPADLYLQRDNGFFVNASLNRRLDAPSRKSVAWGTQAVDFDRDGWLDLAVLNGHVIDRRSKGEPFLMLPQLFRGDVDQFRLQMPDSVTDDYWNRPALGRTMAVLDWNRDLKPDLVCNHLDVPVALLENRTESGSCLQLELVGTTSERDATGAMITVTCGAATWTQGVVGGDGFLCSNEALVDFGLGSLETIDAVQIDWPSGIQQRLVGLTPNQRYLVIENDAQAFSRLR